MGSDGIAPTATRTGSVFVADAAAAAAAAAGSPARGKKRGSEEMSESPGKSDSALSIQIDFSDRASKRGKTDSE